MACLQRRAHADANRDAECESHYQCKSASNRTAAQLLRSQVNFGASAEHQHRESERHEGGQGLNARIDGVDPSAAQDDAGDELPYQDRHQGSPSRGKERP